MNNTYNVKSPILLIVFNRLETTKIVLSTIKEVKPNKLYIASDGPRKDKDRESLIVQNIRDYIIQNVTWECDIRTLFREENISCGLSVKSAIDWFFENENEGIILEDDLKPNMSFFKYCDELLVKYRDDQRIGMISGNNHIGFQPDKDSYLFSRFFNTWGWATWKRSWVNIDFEMEWLQTSYKKSIISNMGYTKKSLKHCDNIIQAIKSNQVNAWDYQWNMSLSAQNQLSIVPSSNLVANIGFGNNATHTTGKALVEYTNIEELLFPLIHPTKVVPNLDYETLYEKKRIILPRTWTKIIPKQIKVGLKKIWSF